ncbi:BatD family protein [Thiococcus pfennigii]|uniref:BatD family protein n=1 Tax=Thiococcus pfennigii TaxID=1057 RepID=UPI0019055B8C|nr:BatD family protein [Thiococcus pfennigii]
MRISDPKRPASGRRPRRLTSPLPLGLLLGLLMYWTTTAQAAEIRAWLTQATTPSDRPVDLIIELSGATASASSPLDLSGLDADFRILDRRTQTSVTIVDGQRSERYRLTLSLLPTRTGEVTIPPIEVGDEASAPLRLTVTEGSALAPIPDPAVPTMSIGEPAPSTVPARATVAAEVTPDEVRVGQQLLLTVRVAREGPLRAARLADPQPDGAEVVPLGEEHSGEIYERRYALFPQRPGPLEIPPLVFEADTPSAPGSGPKSLRAASEALTVAVQPRPAAADEQPWLPARAVGLSETEPSGERTVAPGEALERVISITADGLPASALPELPVAAPFELQVRRAPPELWDERTPQGVVGHRRERIYLTAPEPGRFRLPELRLAWWDTARDAAQVATLPPVTLVAGTTAAGGSSAQVQTVGTEARPPAPRGAGEERGPWLVPGFAILVYLLYLATRRSRRQDPASTKTNTPQTPEPDPPRDPRAEAVAAVRAAYTAGNAAAAREALLAWSRLRWPDDPPGNLARLVLRCPEPLRSQIALLEKAFFSPQPIPWEREPVWKGLAKEDR